jgi:ABC-2 type transport system permease protein
MKVLHVIRREYVENAKKKSFIVSTVLAPVIVLAVYAIPLATVYLLPPEEVSLAVLDRTGSIAPDFVRSLSDSTGNGKQKYRTMIADPKDRDPDAYKRTLVQTITGGGLDALVDIPADVFEKGRVDYISKDHFDERVMDEVREKLETIVIARRLSKEGLDYDRVLALTGRLELNEQKLTKSGVLEEKELAAKFIVVVAFVLILYMTLLSWGISVQRSVIEEKSSRVIEVMLSSLEPRDLFMGKIIGLGGLGLTQIAIWAIILLFAALSSSIAYTEALKYVNVSVSDVAYFLLFFVLGFLLYSSIFTIVGAVCSTEQDAQQLQGIIMLPLIVPIMLVFFVIQNPTSTFAVVLSLIPFFTPMLMLARALVSDPSAWEVALSVSLLVATIYGVIVFSARVFRVGILMYGKRPSLREVFRWFRYA